jgi:hypothetical protein
MMEYPNEETAFDTTTIGLVPIAHDFSAGCSRGETARERLWLLWRGRFLHLPEDREVRLPRRM